MNLPDELVYQISSSSSLYPENAEWPVVLRKACHDSWQFAVGLTNGTVIVFESASIKGDYITLQGIIKPPCSHEFNWGRGIEVHRSMIAWCADSDS
jgi:hypothetical protein